MKCGIKHEQKIFFLPGDGKIPGGKKFPSFEDHNTSRPLYQLRKELRQQDKDVVFTGFMVETTLTSSTV